ncbi:hypothetical protein [Aneurinibacillus thermoaerophilus]|uniref:hypothetical protein n=1 Tax=Aneurinibacillus thermoaerophilus TaxID=143495 RepID=UPI002E24DD50|nr:hypothetical protein [Aneurinibacillus thermoaerophilus]
MTMKAQTWPEFVSAQLPDVILAAPMFELSEATGISTSILEQKKGQLSEEEYLTFVMGSDRSTEEIASILSAHEPWEFGYSNEQFKEE